MYFKILLPERAFARSAGPRDVSRRRWYLGAGVRAFVRALRMLVHIAVQPLYTANSCAGGNVFYRQAGRATKTPNAPLLGSTMQQQQQTLRLSKEDRIALV